MTQGIFRKGKLWLVDLFKEDDTKRDYYTIRWVPSHLMSDEGIYDRKDENVVEVVVPKGSIVKQITPQIIQWLRAKYGLEPRITGIDT